MWTFKNQSYTQSKSLRRCNMADPQLPMCPSQQRVVEAKNGSLSIDAAPHLVHMYLSTRPNEHGCTHPGIPFANHGLLQDPSRRIWDSCRPQIRTFLGLASTWTMVPKPPPRWFNDGFFFSLEFTFLPSISSCITWADTPRILVSNRGGSSGGSPPWHRWATLG